MKTNQESFDLNVKSQSQDNKVQWSYTGNTGPEKWGELAPEFQICSCGLSQSPIDISEYKLTDLPKVIFSYESAKITVINNIHTIQANLVGNNNSVTIDDISYKLTQFHFHAPSEHTINGESFSMELHLVHEDASGNLAVVGVMIKNGIENQVLSPIWDKIFSDQNVQELELEDSFDLVNLLPKESSIYRYNGSLTTPPCTEGVTWIIMEEPIEMSEIQISSFKSFFPPNNRPLQHRNGREIIKYLD